MKCATHEMYIWIIWYATFTDETYHWFFEATSVHVDTADWFYQTNWRIYADNDDDLNERFFYIKW